ncbi:hypothetical protein R3P38DRAFT_2788354 [Favolaschia claudopus]|uniref:Ubiquitin-like protease family profile domain-containing protein n=1 Tax=Favolaschia claudopus TaxID=2862362 RepID=A0AAW0AJR9_9AGAR
MTDHNVVDVLDSDEEDQLPPLNTREWIGKNKKYPLHAPKNLEFYCTRQLRVPKEVKGAFPDNGLSVSAFLRAVVPSKSYGLVFPAPKTCFSSEAPNMDMGQAIEHLKTKSLPPIKYVDQLKQEVRQAILDGKLSVLDARYPYIRFPFWIVMTWQWLIGLADAREEWKAAEDWVNARRGTLVAADVVARRLLTLGWNTQLVAGEQTLQFARAISDRMAVDGMMDVMVGILEKRIAAKPRLMSQIVLVQRAFMIEILKAERAEDYKEVKRPYLAALEGKVKHGGVSELWFTALWEEQKHWLAFKCDFVALTLSYGDPLSMSGNPHGIVRKTLWWLQNRFNKSFRNKGNVLTCGTQTDGNSCGFIAINTIAHHTEHTRGDGLWTASLRFHDRLDWFNLVCTEYDINNCFDKLTWSLEYSR